MNLELVSWISPRRSSVPIVTISHTAIGKSSQYNWSILSQSRRKVYKYKDYGVRIMEAYSIKQWKDRNFRYFNQAYLGDCESL